MYLFLGQCKAAVISSSYTPQAAPMRSLLLVLGRDNREGAAIEMWFYFDQKSFCYY
jgi:hypothetical protein